MKNYEKEMISVLTAISDAGALDKIFSLKQYTSYSVFLEKYYENDILVLGTLCYIF